MTVVRRYGGYEPERRGSLNRRLKVILAIWAIAYPVVACGPAALTEGGISGAIGSIVSLTLGGLLLVPWLLGLLVLGFPRLDHFAEAVRVVLDGHTGHARGRWVDAQAFEQCVA